MQELTVGLAAPQARIGSGIVKVFRCPLPDGVLVIDAATPSASGMVERWLTGFPDPPRWIALTHAHIDHMGGLARLKRAFPSARVLVHPGDAETVRTGRVLIPRLLGPATLVRPLVALAGRLRRLPAVEPDGALDELERFGVVLASTPGHSTPHTAFLLPDGSVFAGDSFSTRRTGRPLVNEFGDDVREMARSIARLAALPGAVRLFPSHGPSCRAEEFRDFAASLSGLGD